MTKINLSLLTSLAAVLLCGCQSAELASRINDFSSSTVNIVSATGSAYKRVDVIHQERLESDNALDYTIGSGNPSGKPAPVTISFYHSNDLQLREEVLQGLALYAANLNAIAGNSTLDAYDAQAKALGQQLKALDADAVKLKIAKNPLSGSELAILTTAVTALGEWLIDYKRDKALRSTIQKMKGPVTNITTLLAKELGKSKDDGLRSVLNEDYDQMSSNRGQLLSHYKTNNPNAFREINETYQDILSLQKQQKVDDETLAQTVVALQNIAKIHASLVDVANNHDENIDGLISDLKAQATHLTSVYNGNK